MLPSFYLYEHNSHYPFFMGSIIMHMNENYFWTCSYEICPKFTNILYQICAIRALLSGKAKPDNNDEYITYDMTLDALQALNVISKAEKDYIRDHLNTEKLDQRLGRTRALQILTGVPPE